MTTIDTHAGAHPGTSRPGAVLSALAWLISSDHKRIGRLLIGEALVSAVGAGVIGALLGLERMGNGYGIFAGDAAVQLIAVFQYLLVFGVLAPVVLGLAVAVVPVQVGSRAISFARLASFGCFLWAFGSIMVIVSIIGNGGPGGGTTDLVDMYVLGVIAASAGLIAVAVSVATTVLTSRAAGMTTDLVPAFSWAGLVGSIGAALSLPVLVGTCIYVYVDHTYAKTAFGGNKGMNEWLHFAFTQPATFVWAAVAVGVLAEIAPVAAGARQQLRGPVFVGLALVSSGALGAVTQSQHLLSTDGAFGDTVKSAVPYLLFNGLPVLGMLAVLGSVLFVLKSGKPRLSGAFALSFLGTAMVLLGMLANLVQGIKSADLIGTSFEEGATTLVAYGALLACIGGVVHWAPKLWGVVIGESKVAPVLGLGLVGTVLVSLGNIAAGLAGQPLGVTDGFSYDGPRGLWNVMVAAGNSLVALGVVALSLGIISAVRGGQKAADDPWNGHTLEWAVPSPAPRDNFESVPTVGSAEPVLDAKPNSEVPA